MVKELDSVSWKSYDEEIGYNTNLDRPNNSEDIKVNGPLVLQQNDDVDVCPTFGNISISNGSDIHFGNKTFYQGPVTIKQFVVADGDKLKKISESEVSESFVEKLNLRNASEGVVNPNFQGESKYEQENGRNGQIVESNNNDSRTLGFLEELKNYLIIHRTQSLSICLCLAIISLTAVTLSQFLKSPGASIVKLGEDVQKIGDDEHDHNTPIDGPIDPTKIKPLTLKIVSRLEWLAQPPTKPTDPLNTPVPYVIISHTATETCQSQAQCVFQVRNIQTYHMESRGWWDIGYNFLVGGDGEVYVGRGWEKEGAHTLGYNKYSIGISFVGTFIDTLPTENQLLACKRLIKKGVELGYLKKDYILLGARQLQTTQSPGTKLFEEIKKWPHWAEKP